MDAKAINTLYCALSRSEFNKIHLIKVLGIHDML